LYLTQKQQELPIEFNLVMYYTIGNITGNVTDSVTDFAIYGKLHHLVFSKEVRKLLKPLVDFLMLVPTHSIFIHSKEEEKCLLESSFQSFLRLR